MKATVARILGTALVCLLIMGNTPLAMNVAHAQTMDQNVSYYDPSTGGIVQKTGVTVYSSADNGVGPTLGGGSGTSSWYAFEGAGIAFSSRVTVEGEVNIILKDNCELTINGGIRVTEGNSLIVWTETAAVTGTLTAQSTANYFACIGGDIYEHAGSVTINGGTIHASPGEGHTWGGAAIGGGGFGGNGGIVTINGGIVNANGGNYASGIGSGGNASVGDVGDAGTVVINGGIVHAENGNRGYGAAIGGGGTTSGYYGGTGAAVTVNGGRVYATANSPSGRGIGGGCAGDNGGDGGSLTFTDGTVTVSSVGNVAHAIGGGTGEDSDGAETTINLPNKYHWWYNTLPSETGATSGNQPPTPFVNSTSYKFVQFQVLSSECKITSFKIGEQYGALDESNSTITVEMPKTNTDFNLTPTIIVSEGATVIPTSGMQQDFTGTAIYMVTAEDNVTSKEYSVTVVQAFEQWVENVEGARVGLLAPVGVFMPGSRFSASSLTGESPDAGIRNAFGRASGRIDSAYSSQYNTLGVYEFYVEDGHSNPYESLSGTATVYREMPRDFDAGRMLIIRIEDGEDVPLQNVRKEVIGGKPYVVADLDHFSEFALLEKKTNPALPQTGDKSPNVLLVGVMLTLLCGVGAMRLFRKKRDQKP